MPAPTTTIRAIEASPAVDGTPPVTPTAPTARGSLPVDRSDHPRARTVRRTVRREKHYVGTNVPRCRDGGHKAWTDGTGVRSGRVAPLRRFRNRHHLSLVVRFAILSLVLVTSLGVVLAWRLHSMIEHRNVASAGTNITLAVDFVANQQVQAGASAPSIATPQQLVQLRASMHALTETGHIAGIAAVLG